MKCVYVCIKSPNLHENRFCIHLYTIMSPLSFWELQMFQMIVLYYESLYLIGESCLKYGGNRMHKILHVRDTSFLQHC